MSEGAVGGLGRRWVIANVVGFGVGAGIFGASQQAWLRPYFEVVTDAGEAARIQALARRWAWRSSVPRSGWPSGWSCALGCGRSGGSRPPPAASGLAARWRAPSAGLGGTVTGIGPQHGVVGFITGVVLSVLALALLPGTLQWTMLRKRSPRAWAWPWVTLGGLFAGLAAAALVVRFGLVYLIPWLQPEDFPSAKALICAGLVMGAVYGMSTRSTLRRTLAPAGHRDS